MAEIRQAGPPEDFWRLWDDYKASVARMQDATERCALRLAIATGCFGAAAGIIFGWMAGRGLI